MKNITNSKININNIIYFIDILLNMGEMFVNQLCLHSFIRYLKGKMHDDDCNDDFLMIVSAKKK